MKPLSKTMESTLKIITDNGGSHPMWKRQPGYHLNAVRALKERGLVRYEIIQNIDLVIVVQGAE